MRCEPCTEAIRVNTGLEFARHLEVVFVLHDADGSVTRATPK
jgi:tRNA (Thr-GGU) A37 N-methylase